MRKICFGFVTNSLESKDVDKLISEFGELFNDELGCYKFGNINFEVEPGTKPIFCKPRKVQLAFQQNVNDELDRLVKEGVLEPVPNADWGTPIVPILKKDSKDVRVCVDYKTTINPLLVDVKVPLPDIDDIFACLSGGIYFSKLDMKNAYNQLPLDESSQMLLAWTTHKGVFGTKTACAHFQATMSKVLHGCNGTVCFCDDISVTGTTMESHMSNLREVFQRLLNAGFRLNLKKCVFFQEKIHYLGHVIDKHGLHKNETKVAAVQKAPPPTNVNEVKAFVRLVNYYGRFFPNLSQVLSPFHNLLKKDTKFVWNDECVKAFEAVKKTIASDQVLVHYNGNLPIKLVCDASNKGIGAAIFHVMPNGEDRPIAFASKTLNKSQQNYFVIDREALAIFYGVKKFSHYLLITIFGNKRGIPAMAASRLQRWSVYLSNYDFNIQYCRRPALN